MKVYHGTNIKNALRLAAGKSDNWFGLYVTDTPERAQLYADAQVTGVVSRTPRYAAGSVIVEMEVEDSIEFYSRPADHSTLDIAEAVVNEWQVTKVVARVRRYDVEHGVMRMGVQYRPVVEVLQEAFGDKLQIVVV